MILLITVDCRRSRFPAPERRRRPKAGQQGGSGGAAPPRHHHPESQLHWDGPGRPDFFGWVGGKNFSFGWVGGGIFLTTILKINPKINPKTNPKINSKINPLSLGVKAADGSRPPLAKPCGRGCAECRTAFCEWPSARASLRALTSTASSLFKGLLGGY